MLTARSEPPGFNEGPENSPAKRPDRPTAADPERGRFNEGPENSPAKLDETAGLSQRQARASMKGRRILRPNPAQTSCSTSSARELQ